MDTLTFSEAKKMPISVIDLKVALEELDMSMEQVGPSVLDPRLPRSIDFLAVQLARTDPVWLEIYPADSNSL